jgi:hypothetical protein
MIFKEEVQEDPENENVGMRYVHIDRLVDPQKKQTRYSVCHASA